MEVTLSVDRSAIPSGGKANVTVTASENIYAIECRATLSGAPWGLGVGTDVLADDLQTEYGFYELPTPSTTFSFDVESSELLNGDGTYRITVFVRDSRGVWDDIELFIPEGSDGLITSDDYIFQVQSAPCFVVFKSQDGLTTYASGWYARGETPVQPRNPVRTSETTGGVKSIYTFTGWALTPNATSGVMNVPAAQASITYYAAFNVSFKYLITFRSYDGSQIYSSGWYSHNSAIPKPVDPYRSPDSGWAENTYTFAGWAPTPNQTSGATTIPAATQSVTYYAAFRVSVTRLYLVKNSTANPNYSRNYNTSTGSANNWNGTKFEGTGGGYHIWRILNINLSQYTKLVGAGTRMKNFIGSTGVASNTINWTIPNPPAGEGGYISGAIASSGWSGQTSPSGGWSGSYPMSVEITYSTNITSGCIFVSGSYTSTGVINTLYLEKTY